MIRGLDSLTGTLILILTCPCCTWGSADRCTGPACGASLALCGSGCVGLSGGLDSDMVLRLRFLGEHGEAMVGGGCAGVCGGDWSRKGGRAGGFERSGERVADLDWRRAR